LIRMLKDMRDEKKFQCGDEMDVEPRLFLGAAANPFADPFEFRVDRLAKKIDAGVDFIQTQGIYDIPRFEKWLNEANDRGLTEKVYILGGVIPLKSSGAAKYIKNKVAGMMVPDELIERMKNASDPKQEGVTIAKETIEQLKNMKGVHGVHIMAIEWEEKVPEIVKESGLLPRPTA
ncbi:MAG: methylenetetrahydrofolate reductase, partial [Thermoplasmata archaeon]